MKNKLWYNKSKMAIDVENVIVVRPRMTTSTGGWGPCSPFNATIYNELEVDVLLKVPKNKTINLYGDDATDFLKFYNNNT